MTTAAVYPIEGGCDCTAIRYCLETAPIIVHCCHCRWCQRESGASFALNALIETSRFRLLRGSPVIVDTPSASGTGQMIARCPTCQVALWSLYGGAKDVVRFVRVGTLDQPDQLPPDIHIFTETKQPWVILPEGVPAFLEYYEARSVWSTESLARRNAVYASAPDADD